MVMLLIAPGAIIGVLSRLPLRVALVAAIPVSYGVAGVASFLFGNYGIVWNALSYAIAVAAVACLGFIVARIPLQRIPGVVKSLFTSRSNRVAGTSTSTLSSGSEVPEPLSVAPAPGTALVSPGKLAAFRSQWSWWILLPGVCVLAAAALITGLIQSQLLTTPLGLDNVFQGWDAHWHVNYLQFIAETGQAAPDHAGLLRHPDSGAQLYYPSAWHAIAALVVTLTGQTPVAVYNVMQIILLAVGFPLGVAALAWWITRRRGTQAFAASAAALAAIATPLFPGLPYMEIMVAATPSATANAFAGVSAALIATAVARPERFYVAVLSLVGLGAVHPSGLMTAAIFVAIWWLCEAIWWPVHGRVLDFTVLAAVGIAGALTLIPQLLSISGEADSIAAFDFQLDDANRAQSWAKAASLQVRHVQDFGIRWVLLGLALAGLVTLLSRRTLWPVLTWGLFFLLTVNAMQTFGNSIGGPLRSVGSAYYNDPRRLGVILAITVAAAVGIGIAATVQVIVSSARPLLPDERSALPLQAACALAAIVAVASWAIQQSPEYAEPAGRNQRWDRLVDWHDRAAFDWLAEQPKAQSGLIFTNPDEGSGWMYALAGLPSTSRHYMQASPQDSPQIVMLWQWLDEAGKSRSVDETLARLGVTYVYISPPNYWEFQKPNLSLLNLDETPGLVKVYADAQVRIFAVRSAFTPAEIDAISASSPHKPSEFRQLTRQVRTGVNTY